MTFSSLLMLWEIFSPNGRPRPAQLASTFGRKPRNWNPDSQHPTFGCFERSSNYIEMSWNFPNSINKTRRLCSKSFTANWCQSGCQLAPWSPSFHNHTLDNNGLFDTGPQEGDNWAQSMVRVLPWKFLRCNEESQSVNRRRVSSDCRDYNTFEQLAGAVITIKKPLIVESLNTPMPKKYRGRSHCQKVKR